LGWAVVWYDVCMTINITARPKIKLLLIVVIIVLIGFVAWYVLNANKVADKSLTTRGKGPAASPTAPTSPTTPPATTSTSTKKYTDSAGIYTLEYPSNWKVVASSGSGEGAMPDWTKTSRTVTFVPPNAPDNNGVVVQADTDGTLSQQIAQSEAGKVQSQIRIDVNGYSARPLESVYTSSTESYTDDRYLIDNNGSEVFITFREKYHRASPAVDWDVTSQVPAFTKILNSITFLK
jgi:hypothetical protein